MDIPYIERNLSLLKCLMASSPLLQSHLSLQSKGFHGNSLMTSKNGSSRQNPYYLHEISSHFSENNPLIRYIQIILLGR